MVAAEAADSEETLAHEKCIKQYVPNARKNAKFLSNQLKESQFIAKNVMPLCQNQADFN
jgi:hypothetical protein